MNIILVYVSSLTLKFLRSATCVFDFIINVKVKGILLLAIFNSRVWKKVTIAIKRGRVFRCRCLKSLLDVDMLLLLKSTTNAQEFFYQINLLSVTINFLI